MSLFVKDFEMGQKKLLVAFNGQLGVVMHSLGLCGSMDFFLCFKLFITL